MTNIPSQLIALLTARDRVAHARLLDNTEIDSLSDYIADRCAKLGEHSKLDQLLVLAKRLEILLIDLDLAQEYVAAPNITEPKLSTNANAVTSRVLGIEPSSSIHDFIVSKTKIAARAIEKRGARTDKENAVAQHIVPGQLVRCNYCGYPFRESDVLQSQFLDIISDQDGRLAKNIDPRRESDPNKPVKTYSKKTGLEKTWTALEIEHITPLCALGSQHQDNLTISCRLCNRGKAQYHTWAEILPYATAVTFAGLGREWGAENVARSLFAVVSRDGACTKCEKTSLDCELTASPSSRFSIRRPTRAVTRCYDHVESA